MRPTYNADPQRVYVMGCSQGAMMSTSVALTRPDLVAGAVLMSGRILPEIGPQIAPPEQLRDLPLLAVHGVADTVLPIQHGRASRRLRSALPVRLDDRAYPLGHATTSHSLADAAAGLRDRLDQAPRRSAP